MATCLSLFLKVSNRWPPTFFALIDCRDYVCYELPLLSTFSSISVCGEPRERGEETKVEFHGYQCKFENFHIRLKRVKSPRSKAERDAAARVRVSDLSRDLVAPTQVQSVWKLQTSCPPLPLRLGLGQDSGRLSTRNVSLSPVLQCFCSFEIFRPTPFSR